MIRQTNEARGRALSGRVTIAWLAGALTIAVTSEAAADTSLPQGTWRITGVHTDDQRTSRASITQDDPALVGRSLASSPARLSLNDAGADTCDGPTATAQSTRLSTLVATTMGARPAGAPPATAADYQLGADRAVQTLWVGCASGRFGPSDFAPHRNAWVLRNQDGSLLIGWADSTILVAEPTARSAGAGPSFSCARARTASEHAICASADLAADDRNVAAAYKGAVYWADNDKGKLALLAKTQLAWQRSRDACGDDQACLAKSMTAQTAKLNDPASFLGD